MNWFAKCDQIKTTDFEISQSTQLPTHILLKSVISQQQCLRYAGMTHLCKQKAWSQNLFSSKIESAKILNKQNKEAFNFN